MNQELLVYKFIVIPQYVILIIFISYKYAFLVIPNSNTETFVEYWFVHDQNLRVWNKSNLMEKILKENGTLGVELDSFHIFLENTKQYYW